MFSGTYYWHAQAVASDKLRERNSSCSTTKLLAYIAQKKGLFPSAISHSKVKGCKILGRLHGGGVDDVDKFRLQRSSTNEKPVDVGLCCQLLAV